MDQIKRNILVFSILVFACEEERPKVNLCELIPDSGPCEAAIPRYYFDQKEKKCKEFTWGGCDGVVPFETMEACQNVCSE